MTTYRDRHHAGHHSSDPSKREKAATKEAELAKKTSSKTKPKN